jgi:hypothetical protein
MEFKNGDDEGERVEMGGVGERKQQQVRKTTTQ